MGDSPRYLHAQQFFKTEKSRLASMGIRSIGLFGSVARGDDRPESDLDVLIEMERDSSLTLFSLIALEQEYSARLHQKVDLVIKDDLKPMIGQSILGEVRYV